MAILGRKKTGSPYCFFKPNQIELNDNLKPFSNVMHAPVAKNMHCMEHIYWQYLIRPVARLGFEGGRDIFQAGPDMFVTLSKRFSKHF